jgi:hypothetical protein
MSLSSERREKCLPKVDGACRHLGPSLHCALLGTYGVQHLRDPKAACPLGRWGHAPDEEEKNIATQIVIGDARATATTTRRHRTWRHYVEGAVRLLALLFPSCRAPVAEVEKRQAECGTCPELGRWHGIRYCRICGCSIRGKTLLAEAACPLHLWDAVATLCWFTALSVRIGLLTRDDGCRCRQPAIPVSASVALPAEAQTGTLGT